MTNASEPNLQKWLFGKLDEYSEKEKDGFLMECLEVLSSAPIPISVNPKYDKYLGTRYSDLYRKWYFEKRIRALNNPGNAWTTARIMYDDLSKLREMAYELDKFSDLVGEFYDRDIKIKIVIEREDKDPEEHDASWIFKASNICTEKGTGWEDED